jgi:glycosyltransferase involved in cell wall biosynthesis
MKICLVAEGSYPYVSGGVSSWIQQLMTNMPEHEFTIIAISPDSSKQCSYKYDSPENLVEIHNVYLDQLLTSQGNWNKKIKISPREVELLGELLKSDVTEWKGVFEGFLSMKSQGISAGDIFSSKIFYDLIQEIYEENFIHVSFADMLWTMRSMYIILFSLLLRKYPEADIYHSVSTGYSGIVAAYAAYTNKSGFVLTEHGIYTREREEEIIKAEWVKGNFKSIWIDYFDCLSDSAYQCADSVISLFPKNKDIQINLGCDENKIKIIHNGINVESFDEIRQLVSERSEKDVFNVGAIVRVVPIKDIKTMLQAFAYVNKRFPDIKFTIMGPTIEDEEYYKECLDYKDFLKLDSVIFTGRVNIKDYLGKMDILVLTSISEGQPLSMLEGMVCSLPFVSTNVGDCETLVTGSVDEYGMAGRIAKIMDYAGIANGIIELYKDYNKRRQFGENGYQRVKHLYSADDFIQGYKDLYTKIGEGDSNGRNRI